MYHAYEDTFGQELHPSEGDSEPLYPTGEPWEEEDLPELFPRLTARARSPEGDAPAQD